MNRAAPAVRAPASSANLGSGFDVFGMALGLHADVGAGPPPDGATALDPHHPARDAYTAFGVDGPLWLRTSIPMARGLGFSGAVRVAAAALGAVVAGHEVVEATAEILDVASRLEGHGDNAAASLFGGVVANVDGRALQLQVGPVLAAARVIAWVPDITTSTDHSRRALPGDVPRAAAVHNIGRVVQLALAVERDDPGLLAGSTDDALHQDARLPSVPGAADAMTAGVKSGAWCGWLSGSGPTVALLCPAERAVDVVAALPAGGHAKTLAIDTRGAHVLA